MDSLNMLSTSLLATRCAEETDKYYRRIESTTLFCFELLRRALHEQNGEAFAFVYQIYYRTVLVTVHRSSRFGLTGESAEYFVNDAFRAFERALRGSKFNLQATLPAIITYLQRCAISSIGMYMRRIEGEQVMPIEPGDPIVAPGDVADRNNAEELWQRVLALLPNEQDRMLARLTFVLQYKPREITALHPAVWPTERSVSVDLFRIRGVLRRRLVQDEREAGSDEGTR